MVATAERKSRVCGHMGDLLPKMFPSKGRLGQGDSKGGVASWKIFPATEVV